MPIFIENEISELKCRYMPSEGGLSHNGINWYGCREEFYDNFIDQTLFHYRLKNKQTTEEIISIFNEFERLMKITESFKIRKTIIQCFNLKDEKYDCAINIDIKNSWWRETIRFNLLTIILRDAQDNWEKTKNGQYCTKGKIILEHFMNNNIYFHGDVFTGFLNTITQELKKEPSGRKSVPACFHAGWKFHTKEIA